MRAIEVEEWKPIEEFPYYNVSNWGNIFNLRTGQVMRTSLTPFGHVKVTLTLEDPVCTKVVNDNGEEEEVCVKRFTRSVPRLVADAFLGKGNRLWDQVIVLDGNFQNVHVSNLAWRPRWFAWKYTRQLREKQPRHYETLPVINVEQEIRYNSIIEAGMAEGLLFSDIWRSTYTGSRVFPTGSIFVVDQRV